MTETTMPVTEATAATHESDVVSYELAYHVLPTVAEGEVAGVTETLKKLITTAGGTITGEEGAERFELAYEIEKYLEGRYRRFNSAYFGWVRFQLEAGALASVTEEVAAHKQLLRHLIVRLTKVEEANPFKFHEAIEKTAPRVIDMTDEDVVDGEEVVDAEADGIIVPDVDATEEKTA